MAHTDHFSQLSFGRNDPARRDIRAYPHTGSVDRVLNLEADTSASASASVADADAETDKGIEPALHFTVITERGSFAIAYCCCGWHGAARRSRDRARMDASEHAGQ